MFLNTSWVKEEIKTETGKSLDLNENTTPRMKTGHFKTSGMQ